MSGLSKAFNIEDLRLMAKSRLPRGLFEFIDRGAEDEIALKNNRGAFDRLLLKPNALDVSSGIDLRTTLFGQELAMPLAIAPTGIVGLTWFEGEIAAARAAARAGIPYSLSTASITSAEDVAKNVHDGQLWFQLYVWNTQLQLTFDLVKRVKAAGYRALIVTVDGAGGANREYNQRNQFTVPMRMSPKAVTDVLKRPGWMRGVMMKSLMASGVPTFANYPAEYRTDILGRTKGGKGMAALGNPAVSADLLKQLRDQWDGPLLVKGILSAKDALTAVRCGADGVVVSNHGGRTLDAAVSAIDALPEIVAAVGSKVEVLMDSGVRRGSDVVKALALGAKAVLVGRAPIWGTAVAGTDGAFHALSILKTEMTRVMVQLGCANVSQIGPACLWRETPTEVLSMLERKETISSAL